DMNRSTDLLSRESAENPRHRCLGPAVTGVFLGLMSFVGAFALLTSSKTGAPADDNGPVTKKTEGKPAETAVASSDQEPDPRPGPQPDPDPLPPESLAFAGKNPSDEWSANGLRMKFCWCPAGTFIMGSPKDEKEREPPYCEFSEDQVEVKL